MTRALWCWLAASALLACGARSALDPAAAEGLDATALSTARDTGVDVAKDVRRAADATRDAGFDSGAHDAGGIDAGHDAGAFDAGHDAHHHRRDAHAADAEDDARALDAGEDAPSGDAGFDAGDATGCPSTYPSGACSALGEVCTYPQGQCTCFDTRACGCGTPPSCGEANAQCGSLVLCATMIDCGTCPAGERCVNNRCSPVGDAAGCVPKTCADQGIECGTAPDGCGALLECGDCRWSCNPVHTPCPVAPPTLAAPCASPGAKCTYTEWSNSCCVGTFVCSLGIWQSGAITCPE
jgi:hypothetical protein